MTKLLFCQFVVNLTNINDVQEYGSKVQSAWEVGAEAKAIPANFTTTYFEGNF